MARVIESAVVLQILIKGKITSTSEWTRLKKVSCCCCLVKAVRIELGGHECWAGMSASGCAALWGLTKVSTGLRVDGSLHIASSSPIYASGST